MARKSDTAKRVNLRKRDHLHDGIRTRTGNRRSASVIIRRELAAMRQHRVIASDGSRRGAFPVTPHHDGNRVNPGRDRDAAIPPRSFLRRGESPAVRAKVPGSAPSAKSKIKHQILCAFYGYARS